jgi:predicted RNase H-like nuclease
MSDSIAHDPGAVRERRSGVPGCANRSTIGHDGLMIRVLGVDVAGKYWVAVASDLRVYADRTLVELLAAADADGTVEVVGIDIPIGLPTGDSPRQADALARKVVGPRWPSVFMTPPRAVLTALTYADASAEARRLMNKGISQQAWALRSRILEADLVVRSVDRTIVEVHPEVSFRTLAGRHLLASKSTWAGLEDRRSLLAAAGFVLPAALGRPGLVAGADDVLDAAVACWTAWRVAGGVEVRYPDEPEVLDGIAACIYA